MILLRQIRSFLLTMSLTLMLAITVGFDFGSTASLLQVSHSPQTQIASMGNVATGLEGQAQQAIGNMTGNHKDQIMGTAKQVEAQALNAGEDLKDNIDFQSRSKDMKDSVENQAKDLKDNLKDVVN